MWTLYKVDKYIDISESHRSVGCYIFIYRDVLYFTQHYLEYVLILNDVKGIYIFIIICNTIPAAAEYVLYNS